MYIRVHIFYCRNKKKKKKRNLYKLRIEKYNCPEKLIKLRISILKKLI